MAVVQVTVRESGKSIPGTTRQSMKTPPTSRRGFADRRTETTRRLRTRTRARERKTIDGKLAPNKKKLGEKRRNDSNKKKKRKRKVKKKISPWKKNGQPVYYQAHVTGLTTT